MKGERTKGVESEMESFKLTLCMETAVSEQLTLWKHLQTHQFKELHLQLCLSLTV